jgi:hypothetical protein
MKEKFPRKCDATGVGMHVGYVAADGMHHFSEKKYLIEYLRTLDIVNPDASDEFLLTEAYILDEYYYTEWDVDDEDVWYEECGGVLVTRSREQVMLENTFIMYDEDRDHVFQREDGLIIRFLDYEQACFWERDMNDSDEFDCNYEAMCAAHLPDHQIERIINQSNKVKQ